jgi:integrase
MDRGTNGYADASKLRLLVTAALLTGCRFGELAALATEDVNADAGTVSIRTSKSGKPRHVVLTDEGREFFTRVQRHASPNSPSSPKRMTNLGLPLTSNARSPLLARPRASRR